MACHMFETNYGLIYWSKFASLSFDEFIEFGFEGYYQIIL